ncbi:hypothetical protein GCM10027072_74420 [Streptomyces bullii]
MIALFVAIYPRLGGSLQDVNNGANVADGTDGLRWAGIVLWLWRVTRPPQRFAVGLLDQPGPGRGAQHGLRRAL